MCISLGTYLVLTRASEETMSPKVGALAGIMSHTSVRVVFCVLYLHQPDLLKRLQNPGPPALSCSRSAKATARIPGGASRCVCDLSSFGTSDLASPFRSWRAPDMSFFILEASIADTSRRKRTWPVPALSEKQEGKKDFISTASQLAPRVQLFRAKPDWLCREPTPHLLIWASIAMSKFSCCPVAGEPNQDAQLEGGECRVRVCCCCLPPACVLKGRACRKPDSLAVTSLAGSPQLALQHESNPHGICSERTKTSDRLLNERSLTQHSATDGWSNVFSRARLWHT